MTWPPGSTPPEGSEVRCARCKGRVRDPVPMDEGYVCAACITLADAAPGFAVEPPNGWDLPPAEGRE